MTSTLVTVNPLPPVSPGKFGARQKGATPVTGIPPYATPRNVHEILTADHVPDHPFDSPFSLIKTMQAELTRLKEELQREQHERKVDVANLKKEVSDLREQVRRDEQKQDSDNQQIVQIVKELQIKEERDWRATRKEMEVEFSKRTFCVQHDTLTERVDANHKWLKEANDLVSKHLQSLERRIQQNSDGDNAFAQEMKSGLTAQKRQIDINTINDEEFAQSVLSRMRAAGQVLKNAGTSGVQDKTGVLKPKLGSTSTSSAPPLSAP